MSSCSTCNTWVGLVCLQTTHVTFTRMRKSDSARSSYTHSCGYFITPQTKGAARTKTPAPGQTLSPPSRTSLLGLRKGTGALRTQTLHSGVPSIIVTPPGLPSWNSGTDTVSLTVFCFSPTISSALGIIL